MQESSLKTGIDVIRQKAKSLSLDPGVYRMLSAEQDVLYVGKAKHLKKRVMSYTQVAQLPMRLKRMIALTQDMEFIVTKSEEEALLLEAQLIKKLKPRYNVLLRDDKSFPYIWVQEHAEAPRVVKYRGRPGQEKGTYFGPFASTRAMYETTDTLIRLFQLRTCTDHVYKNRSRPCLQYHIKRCSAPCVGYISQPDYQESVQQATDFLRGKTRHIQQELEKKMQLASDHYHYEEAALYRDRIRSLNMVQQQAQELGPELSMADIFALVQQDDQTCIQVFFYRHGASYGNRAYFPRHDKGIATAEILGTFLAQFYQSKQIPRYIFLSEETREMALLKRALKSIANQAVAIKVPKRGRVVDLVKNACMNAKLALERHRVEQLSNKKILEEVATFFNLEPPVKRIEIYDNSHLSGTNPYGTLVVAGLDGFDKKAYRQFKIKGVSGTIGDDYGMMQEVFERRFRGVSQDDMPNLVLIDGGKGQLNVCLKVLSDLSLQTVCVGVAKGPERHAGRETLHYATGIQQEVPQNHPVTFYIQRLRDEAHRFAIGTHRQGRAKKMVHSTLQEIPGIGPRKKKALMTYFGGLDRMKRAGVEDFENVPGITTALARQLYAFFNG